MEKMRRTDKRQVRDCLARYMYILPATLFMLVFLVYPMISNLILSLNDVGLTFFSDKEYHWVGLQNYIDLFTAADGLLLNAIKNTVVFTVITVIFQILISFALSLIFSQKYRIAKVSRGIILIAYILPVTVTTLLFKFIFMTDGGILNYLLQKWGIISSPVPWLIEANTAMASIIVTNLWINIPFSMLMFTSGLITLDSAYLEAAMIDGAGYWKRLIYVVIPSISETFKIVVTLAVIYAFKVYDVVFIMTNGGPAMSTDMLSTYAYRMSFTYHNYSDGAAAANILLIILLIMGTIYIRLIKKEAD